MQTEDTSASTLPFENAEMYKGFIAKARALGAARRSLSSLMQEWHQYAKTYPVPNLAVDLCIAAFTQAVQEQLDKKAPTALAKEAGHLAYCGFLPKLCNRECVRDFIACVVHGMSIGIIPGSEGTRLLYGAQVAQAALPPVRKWRKNTIQTAPKPAETCTQTAPKPHPNPTSKDSESMVYEQKHPTPPPSAQNASATSPAAPPEPEPQNTPIAAVP